MQNSLVCEYTHSHQDIPNCTAHKYTYASRIPKYVPGRCAGGSIFVRHSSGGLSQTTQCVTQSDMLETADYVLPNVHCGADLSGRACVNRTIPPWWTCVNTQLASVN